MNNNPFKPSNRLLQRTSRLSHYILPIIMILLIVTPVWANQRAVIHHTETKDVSIKVIRQYHMEVKGWDDVGYHFLIRENGDVETGRLVGIIGAHAPGRNHWIGIALTGKDFFSIFQFISLNKLLRELGVEYIERHHEECPGDSLTDFIATYNGIER